MLKMVTKVVGAVFLVCGSLLFFIITVDLSADVRIAGPMNLWPPPIWVYLMLDAIFALLIFFGMKIIGLKRIGAGYLMAVIGRIMLIFVATNDINAPAREGRIDGRYVPADVSSYIAAYMIAASVLCVGLWFINQHVRRRKLSEM